MADIKYMKAVEFDKLPVALKKALVSENLLDGKGYWLQKKYDGCFGKAYIVKKRADCYMHSRTGEDYSASCAHILDELHILAAGDEEPAVLLGEIWAKGVKFPDISGMFRRQSKGAQMALSFVLNDILDPDMETHVAYSARFDELEEFVLAEEPRQPHIMIAKTFKSRQWHLPVKTLAVQWQEAGGFDGAILRNPNAGYTFGLVKQGEIIKVKPLLSLDLRIGLIKTEPGAKTNRPVHTIGVTYRGVTSWVGSGVPHNIGEVGKVGAIVQIDSLGLTEDGKLREPRYIGIRHDKEEPDA